MKKLSVMFSIAVFVGMASSVNASDYSRVDRDIETYDNAVASMNAQFNQTKVDLTSKSWVTAKIQHMVDVDQYMRRYIDTPFNQRYTDAEKKEFWMQLMPRFAAVDETDTADLKALMKIYTWFTISSFGAQTDRNAWLLVQHADLDPDFQKQVLAVLESLYAKGETNAGDYAYLYDRVAASYKDPSKRQLQRYGTQGMCTGPGVWQALPIEDPIHLDDRRASVGLEPEANYLKVFKDICH